MHVARRAIPNRGLGPPLDASQNGSYAACRSASAALSMKATDCTVSVDCKLLDGLCSPGVDAAAAARGPAKTICQPRAAGSAAGTAASGRWDSSRAGLRHPRSVHAAFGNDCLCRTLCGRQSSSTASRTWQRGQSARVPPFLSRGSGRPFVEAATRGGEDRLLKALGRPDATSRSADGSTRWARRVCPSRSGSRRGRTRCPCRTRSPG